MRNSSPKPSRRLLSRPLSASKVVSRRETPVPPVLISTSALPASSTASTWALTS